MGRSWRLRREGGRSSIFGGMKHIAAALLIACSLHASAQGLPSAPPSYEAKEIKGVQPNDLVAPAAFMAFGMLVAGNFATSTSWNQNEMAGPVLVLIYSPFTPGRRKFVAGSGGCDSPLFFRFRPFHTHSRESGISASGICSRHSPRSGSGADRARALRHSPGNSGQAFP